MNATNLRFLPANARRVLLGACSERVDLEVRARIDGQPAAQATVAVDARSSASPTPKACSRSRSARRPAPRST